jgi:hypothetical protein
MLAPVVCNLEIRDGSWYGECLLNQYDKQSFVSKNLAEKSINVGKNFQEFAFCLH